MNKILIVSYDSVLADFFNDYYTASTKTEAIEQFETDARNSNKTIINLIEL